MPAKRSSPDGLETALMVMAIIGGFIGCLVGGGDALIHEKSMGVALGQAMIGTAVGAGIGFFFVLFAASN